MYVHIERLRKNFYSVITHLCTKVSNEHIIEGQGRHLFSGSDYWDTLGKQLIFIRGSLDQEIPFENLRYDQRTTHKKALLHPQNSLKLHSEKFMPLLMAMCGDDCSAFPTICSNQTTSLMEDQYDLVISKLQEEETNVTNDIQRNRVLLPNLVKKGTINLQIDQRVLKSFKDERNPSNFSFYLTQRRQSSQSIDSAMTQCSQFATYCKSKSPDLKDLHTPEELFHQISTRLVLLAFLTHFSLARYPTLCHQFFDYLQRSNIKASSIMGRIDTLILLFDWIRINSNDINVYKDVCISDRMRSHSSHR